MSLTVEQVNDIMDAKPYAATKPGSEDAYGSMMAQMAKAEGHTKKAPRPMPRAGRSMEYKTKAVIAALEEHGPQTHKGMAELVDISPTTVYDYISGAIEAGYVELINPNTIHARFRLTNGRG